MVEVPGIVSKIITEVLFEISMVSVHISCALAQKSINHLLIQPQANMPTQYTYPMIPKSYMYN